MTAEAADPTQPTGDRGNLTDGAEHLQRALREMIQAARAVLDVVEDMVDDPDRVQDVVDDATGAVGDVISMTRRRPKPNNPWFDDAYVGADGGHGDSSDTETTGGGGFEKIDLG